MKKEMSFKEFTNLAKRTESKVEKLKIDKEQIMTVLDLVILSGKLLDYMKKGMFYNNYEKYENNVDWIRESIIQLNENVKKLNKNIKESSEETNLNYRVIHGLLGAITESFEIAEHLKKILNGEEIDVVGIGEEFADTDWYKAILFDELNLSESDCREAVINKLKVRYPDKYSDDYADSRDLDSERETLERMIVGS